MQAKQLHVIPHTLFPRLPTPAPTPRPLNHQPSASRHPIIYTLTFQMSKPSQSSTPHHISNTINTKKVLTAPSVLQGHPTHPSHHHTFCPFQTSQIISLHCPGFSSTYQNTLDTSTIDPSFDTIRCTTHSQNRRKLLKLGPILWNSLPNSLKDCVLLSAFQAELKTCLFKFQECIRIVETVNCIRDGLFNCAGAFLMAKCHKGVLLR